MKKFIVTLLTLLFSLTSSYAYATDLVVNNKVIDCEVPPQIINGRTMVPIRAVAESLGADVSWANDTVYVTQKLAAPKQLTERQWIKMSTDLLNKRINLYDNNDLSDAEKRDEAEKNLGVALVYAPPENLLLYHLAFIQLLAADLNMYNAEEAYRLGSLTAAEATAIISFSSDQVMASATTLLELSKK